ncbi:Glycosyl transferase, family 4, conserved region-containing protein [Stanieria cyanosphaera PCC 7437]|uniref:Glycosyl transferase, family 4, conserved region-containing protein n=1 Tax=Stanieria cyanosphaera (strain ATCC 29371 / PCC 7437) TaxID=111780 RepID=K9XZU8_STAC7|nr:glycosyltransferase family 4 protein [Stanieria cyanosphaera]AFZ37651.1 Glycosyl transferase, family 4, conserved region-containing protein [Stanieria cyanosphaera PCC 7437]
MTMIVLLILSFTLSVNITFVLKKYFNQKLLDIPNERSSHHKPIPRGGGLGFLLAFTITGFIVTVLINFFPQITSQQLFNLNFVKFLIAIAPVAIIGFIDDRGDVPARIRYLVQLITAIIIIISFGEAPLPKLSNFDSVNFLITFSFTLIGITALINFYNFMDGLDGLVAGVTTIQLSFLAIYLHQSWLWLLVSALIGFLYWNWSPAKIFMGDVGSTALGATIPIALLNSSYSNYLQAWSAFSITFPLIGDAIYTLLRRFWRGENIFQAHRSHLYQRLQQSGCSHQQVALIYMGLTLLCAIVDSVLGFEGIKINLILSLMAIAVGEIYLQSKTPLQT